MTELNKKGVRRALHGMKGPFNNFIPLTFEGRYRTDAMMNLLGKLPHMIVLVRRREVNKRYKDGMGILHGNPLRLFASFDENDEEDILFEDLANARKDVQVDAPSVLNIREDDPFGRDDEGDFFFERWSWYLPMFLKHEGRAETVRMLKSVARILPEPPEDATDDHEKIIDLLDLLYVHAKEKHPDVVGRSGGGGGGGGTDLTTTKRHVPVVPVRMTIGLVNTFDGEYTSEGLQPLLPTEKVTVAGRDFVVYSDSSKTMYAEVGRGNISTGVVVREESGRLTAFESTDVDVNVGFEETSYENIPYTDSVVIRHEYVESYVSTRVSGAFQTIASTNVQDLMVASKDGGEYTHFIDSRGSDAFPEWVKAMRHATQGPKYVLTLALTPFGKSEDGLATAILKEPPDDGRPEPDGYEHHLLMNDELWNSVQCLVYPIPRAKGSLDSLGIMEWPVFENSDNKIWRPDKPADGEYFVLEGPDDNTSWAQKHLVPLDGFVIMGYLYRANESGGNTPVNVVALRHKTFPVVKKNPTYPMKMQMKEGGISQFPDSQYVSHLAIADLPFQTEGVIQWVLGEQFQRLMNQTQELGEEGDATNAKNIFYDIGTANASSIQIFPLSGNVLRVKKVPEIGSHKKKHGTRKA